MCSSDLPVLDEKARFAGMRTAAQQLAEQQSAPAAVENKPTGTLQSVFGVGEALLNDPIYGAELKAMQAAFNKGNLALAQDLYVKSKWGKLDSTTQQRYLNKIQNSDLYNKTYNAWVNRIKPLLASKGLKADDATLKKYFDDGIDDATIYAELSKGISAKGAAGETQTALESLRKTAYKDRKSTRLNSSH